MFVSPTSTQPPAARSLVEEVPLFEPHRASSPPTTVPRIVLATNAPTNPDDRQARGGGGATGSGERWLVGIRVQPHARQFPTSSMDIDHVPVRQSPAETLWSSHPLPSSASTILSGTSSSSIVHSSVAALSFPSRQAPPPALGLHCNKTSEDSH
ncbi:hypothetical protein BDQ17DRAFT_1436558 [Cyathus striatus]|nr:hypothetical protein BDQ17DRAFT_1436558 [Cyathus striatus]